VTEPLRLAFTVDCAAEHAFELWSARTSFWWPVGHTVTAEPGLEVVVEPRVGGRIFERTPAGREEDWGEIVLWEPPRRLAYTWHLRQDRADTTEVEIAFTPQADGSTRVEIEHRGWERLGAPAEERRERNRRGWGGVTPRYRIAALINADDLVIEDWTGEPGPVAPLHVHHEDDEAWLVLDGVLAVHVGDEEVSAGPGEAVRVPAGTPHAYEIAEPARYLIATPPRIRELIARLHEPGETDWSATPASCCSGPRGPRPRCARRSARR
jgi:mannose-6-phosphate isomerase-like protein (cupin superfamily)